jgi:PBP1b-binding outer membrane lipoprotein LpoB
MSGGKRYSAIILRTLFSAVVFSSSFGQNDSGTLDAGAVTIPVSAPDPEGQLIEEPAPLREEDAVQSGDRETTPDAALTSIVSQQQQSNKDNVTIAVNTLLAKGMDKESADLLSERLRVEMVKTGSFNVMERAQMEEIFQEQSFQQSDVCNEQSCIVEMGQLLGVERIIAGTVGKIGRMYTFSLKMINVRTGQIMYTVDEDCDCPIEHRPKTFFDGAQGEVWRSEDIVNSNRRSCFYQQYQSRRHTLEQHAAPAGTVHDGIEYAFIRLDQGNLFGQGGRDT